MGRIRFPPAFIVSCVKTLRLLTKASVMRVIEGGREGGRNRGKGREGWADSIDYSPLSFSPHSTDLEAIGLRRPRAQAVTGCSWLILH